MSQSITILADEFSRRLCTDPETRIADFLVERSVADLDSMKLHVNLFIVQLANSRQRNQPLRFDRIFSECSRKDLSCFIEHLNEELYLSGNGLADELGIAEIAGFQIKEILGIGGMATVFLGIDPEQQQYAIKQAHPEPIKQQKLAEERQKLQKLNQRRVKGVPSLVSLPENLLREEHILVYEYVSGCNLSDWIKNHHPTLKQRIAITEQFRVLMQSIHAAGIVHGDLSTDNIIIQTNTTEPQLYLIDFSEASTSLANASNQPAGKLNYLAPEIIEAILEQRAIVINQPNELWAWGVIAFELIEGRHPYGEFDLEKHALPRWLESLQQSPRYVFQTNISRTLQESILKCLKADPDLRTLQVSKQTKRRHPVMTFLTLATMIVVLIYVISTFYLNPVGFVSNPQTQPPLPSNENPQQLNNKPALFSINEGTIVQVKKSSNGYTLLPTDNPPTGNSTHIQAGLTGIVQEISPTNYVRVEFTELNHRAFWISKDCIQ